MYWLSFHQPNSRLLLCLSMRILRSCCHIDNAISPALEQGCSLKWRWLAEWCGNRSAMRRTKRGPSCLAGPAVCKWCLRSANSTTSSTHCQHAAWLAWCNICTCNLVLDWSVKTYINHACMPLGLCLCSIDHITDTSCRDMFELKLRVHGCPEHEVCYWTTMVPWRDWSSIKLLDMKYTTVQWHAVIRPQLPVKCGRRAQTDHQADTLLFFAMPAAAFLMDLHHHGCCTHDPACDIGFDNVQHVLSIWEGFKTCLTNCCTGSCLEVALV